jgi:hypothetical protein
VLAVMFIIVITVRREGFLGQREVPLDRLFDPAFWQRGSQPPPPSADAVASTPASQSE